MINNSFLFGRSPWLRDGEAIVATTEDEGLWVSFDFGTTWFNLEYSAQLLNAIIPTMPDTVSGNVPPYTKFPVIWAATTDAKLVRYSFDNPGFETNNRGVQSTLIKNANIPTFIEGRDVFFNINGQMKTDDLYSFVGATLYDIIAIDVNTAWALTNAGGVLAGTPYDNDSWAAITLPSGMTGAIKGAVSASTGAIYFFGAGHVWKGAYNDAANWAQVTIANLNFSTLPLQTTSFADAGGNAAIVASEGYVFQTTDGGDNWAQLYSSVATKGVSMNASGSIRALAIYEQPLLVSRWGGAFQTALPSKKYTSVSVYKTTDKRVHKPKIII